MLENGCRDSSVNMVSRDPEPVLQVIRLLYGLASLRLSKCRAVWGCFFGGEGR